MRYSEDIQMHEREDIMKYAHEGTMGGHYTGKVIVHKIMHVSLWCPTMFRDTKEYCEAYAVCQRVGKA